MINTGPRLNQIRGSLRAVCWIIQKKINNKKKTLMKKNHRK